MKRRQQSAGEAVSTSGTIPGLRIVPRAADYERACMEALRQAQVLSLSPTHLIALLSMILKEHSVAITACRQQPSSWTGA